MIIVGPAGNSEEFYSSGHKHSVEAPKWLREIGLNGYEYQFGHGVTGNDETFAAIKKECEKYQIEISCHSPYYVNLANEDDAMAEKSIGYIIASAKAVKKLGGNRVVFHPAGQGKLSREKAFALTMKRAELLIERLMQEDLSDVYLCPETMGKMRQIADLEEDIKIARLSENFIPCIDFGHLNARTQGGIKTVADYEEIIEKILNGIGERGREFHVHFSKIQYSVGGEVRHLTFEDEIYGPEFEPLAIAISKLKVLPHIICESAGTQSGDAVLIRKILDKTV